MNPHPFLTACLVALGTTIAAAQEAPPIGPPLPPQPRLERDDAPLGPPLPREDHPDPFPKKTALPASERRDFHAQGNDVAALLSTLAEEAGMNVILDQSVTGKITLRMQSVTAREAFAALVAACALEMQETGGVWVVRQKRNAAPESPPKRVVQGAMPGPESSQTSHELAKFYWEFYQALVSHGFTREEAMQIIVETDLPAEWRGAIKPGNVRRPSPPGPPPGGEP